MRTRWAAQVAQFWRSAVAHNAPEILHYFYNSLATASSCRGRFRYEKVGSSFWITDCGGGVQRPREHKCHGSSGSCLRPWHPYKHVVRLRCHCQQPNVDNLAYENVSALCCCGDARLHNERCHLALSP